MRASRGPLELQVRGFTPEDEDAVLELLRAALGEGPAGQRSREFFRWKHLENPFGRSFMLVAETEGKIVGLRAFMRWAFRAAGQGISPAVRAVDTATHPDFQGRGIFRRLTLQALETLRDEADLVFNTPNDKSLPGYLKMGWEVVGRVPVSVRVRRPIRLLREFGRLGNTALPPELPSVHAPTAAEVLADADDLERLVEEAGDRDGSRSGGLATPLDVRFLRWRYGAPSLDYRAVLEPAQGPVRGLAIFRVRPRGSLWETTVAEVLVPTYEDETARSLLRAVAAASPVDHLTCSLPPDSAAARAARRTGFLPTPRGITLVVNRLRDDLLPDPTKMRSWRLSLGDLEVF